MTNLLSHLDGEAEAWLKLSDEERISKIQGERWIGYDKAKEIIAKLTRLMNAPKRTRRRNLLIVGDTNNGKTKIIEQFAKQHPEDENVDGDAKIIPVIIVQAPATADEGRFYSLILSKLNALFRDSDKPGNKYLQVVRICEQVGLRMLIIDEIHDIIAGKKTNQRVFRSAIRHLGNDLRIPIVGVGIREAYNAIRSDDQLANRFDTVELPRWKINDDLPPEEDPYMRLLASFERMIPLRNPSHLIEKTLALKLLSMSEGFIGELSTVLETAAELAIRNHREKIDVAILNEIEWTSPSDRNSRMSVVV